MANKTWNSYLCPSCRGLLYCMDSRLTSRKGKRRRIKNAPQSYVKKWCCIDCGNRYQSMDVLNPIAFMNKPMPEGKLREVLDGR